MIRATGRDGSSAIAVARHSDTAASAPARSAGARWLQVLEAQTALPRTDDGPFADGVLFPDRVSSERTRIEPFLAKCEF